LTGLGVAEPPSIGWFGQHMAKKKIKSFGPFQGAKTLELFIFFFLPWGGSATLDRSRGWLLFFFFFFFNCFLGF
jgi:hypothetical protein